MHDGRIDQVGSPQEIYERPTTAFVSSFVGHVTLLGGESDGRGGFAADLPLQRGLPALLGETPAGRTQLVLRPENLDVVDEADAHFIGALLRSSYQGRSYRAAIRLADGTVCEVEHRRAASAAAGDRVGIRVQQASLVPESDDYYRENVGDSADAELADVA
ncbi:TOBE domain-containing protein [Bacillus tequilensis]|nr:TOBE domain-containing protein [Bacillus tequilensis]